MAKTKKVKKPLKYSEVKNQEKPPQVIEAKPLEMEEYLPESKSITPVKEFSRPIVSVEDAQAAFHQYQQLMAALLNEGDIVEIQGKKKIKKSGMNKIARFFGISVEIIKDKVEKVIGPMGGTVYVFKVWARGILPNGQFRVAGGACSSNERRFTHIWHDPWMMAETRAKKRVIEELAAIGDIELEEEQNGTTENEISDQNPEQKPRTFSPKPNENTGYRKSGVVNPKMPASLKQKEYINTMIDKLRNDYELETELELPVEQLNKGQAADLIEKLLKRGKEAKNNIRKEISTGEPPSEENPKEPERNGSIFDAEREF